ncbi:hypothetical protein RKD28_003198 [Streptomyces sp. SAI-229]
MLAHGQARARFGVARDVGDEVAGAHLRQRLQPAAECLRAPRLQQRLAQGVVDAEGRVAHGVGAAGDRGLRLAEGDLVGGGDDGLESGAAGLLDVVGGGAGVECRAEDGLAGEVEVTAVLEDRPGDELPDGARCLKSVPLDESVQRGGEHLLVGGGGVGAVGAGEGDAAAADDRDAPDGGGLGGAHLDLLLTVT